MGDVKINVWIRLKGEVCNFFCVKIASIFALMHRDLNSANTVALCHFAPAQPMAWVCGWDYLFRKHFFFYSCILALHFVLLCTSKIMLIRKSALFNRTGTFWTSTVLATVCLKNIMVKKISSLSTSDAHISQLCLNGADHDTFSRLASLPEWRRLYSSPESPVCE